MSAIQTTARLADLFSSRNIAAYYDTMQQDVRPYPGEAIFPAARTSDLTLSFIKGKADSPVLLRPSAFDAHAPIRPRANFQKVSNEMPFFRESTKIGEKERREVIMAISAGDQYVNSVINRLYDDQYQLVLGADAAAEFMRMTLLSTGAIEVLLDQVPMQYSYGFDPSKQEMTLTGTAMWTNPATATPLADLTKAMKDARLTGARAIMTQSTYQNMLAADSVRNAMFPQNPPSWVSPAQISQFVSNALNISFVVLDDLVNSYSLRVGGEAQTMFPDGVVSLIPAAGSMGNTWYSDTPESIDLMADSSLDATIVGNGVAVLTIVEPHPVNINTIVSQIVLPSCEQIARLYIMNVYTV